MDLWKGPEGFREVGIITQYLCRKRKKLYISAGGGIRDVKDSCYGSSKEQ